MVKTIAIAIAITYHSKTEPLEIRTSKHWLFQCVWYSSPQCGTLSKCQCYNSYQVNGSLVIDEMVLSFESFITDGAGEGPGAVHSSEVSVQTPLIGQLPAAHLTLPACLPGTFLKLNWLIYKILKLIKTISKTIVFFLFFC